MYDADEIRERQESLERALQEQVHHALEFEWSVDEVGQMLGAARYAGNETISFWILPTGQAVTVH